MSIENKCHGEVTENTVILTIDEVLPKQKSLTGAVQDYWLELIQSAISKSAQQHKLPYFDKAFVWIEVITPKHTDNTQLWDTSNRAINLIINNLKGVFFEDDNLEHMAFGVVGSWGEVGQTIVRIMDYERVEELIKS